MAAVAPHNPPPNLHVRAAACGDREREERVERKFFVAPAGACSALALLRRTCRWDADFPREQISSLYFDTRDLDQHERSMAGEFAKDKVRIRWYGDDTPSAELTPVWLELKSRRGFVSTKQRRRVDVPTCRLLGGRLGAGVVPGAFLIETMADFGFFPAGRLVPVVAISYFRYRFLEPRSGFRVSFDTSVRSSLVLPGAGRGERALRLPGSVIEVKGPTVDIPFALKPVAGLGSSWTPFSKYSASIEAHLSELGSVSRLWPSGFCRTPD